MAQSTVALTQAHAQHADGCPKLSIRLLLGGRQTVETWLWTMVWVPASGDGMDKLIASSVTLPCRSTRRTRDLSGWRRTSVETVNEMSRAISWRGGVTGMGFDAPHGAILSAARGRSARGPLAFSAGGGEAPDRPTQGQLPPSAAC